MNTKLSRSKGLIGDMDLSGIPKWTGYAPGVYYDKDDMSTDNQRRFGNLITGTGLGLAGMAAVPIAQWLMPDRFAKFKGQGKRMAIAAMIAGLSAPWLATLPAEIRGYQMRKHNSTKESSLPPFGSPLAANFPILKSHLAGDILDEIQSGSLDPQVAMGFMRNVGEVSPGGKPWVTVNDLTRIAVGAGVGGVLGSLVGKGLGHFVSLSHKEKQLVRNAGIGLGALINTGKLGL